MIPVICPPSTDNRQIAGRIMVAVLGARMLSWGTAARFPATTLAVCLDIVRGCNRPAHYRRVPLGSLEKIH